MSRAHPAIPRRPRGAVLFIALVMLILLTLIGVTGMQVTLLQERMSGNFRAQHQSFERAETRMIEGRDRVSDRLTAYDAADIEHNEVELVDGKALPWQSWLTAYPPVADLLMEVRCGMACGSNRARSTMWDPNKDLRFYTVTGQEKDPSSDVSSAAWSTVQTIYVY